MVDDLRDKLRSGVVLLASESDGKVSLALGVTPDLKDRLKAGDLVREVAAVVGGKGGGRADFAQAGGNDPGRIDEAFEKLFSLVEAGARDASLRPESLRAGEAAHPGGSRRGGGDRRRESDPHPVDDQHRSLRCDGHRRPGRGSGEGGLRDRPRRHSLGARRGDARRDPQRARRARCRGSTGGRHPLHARTPR